MLYMVMKCERSGPSRWKKRNDGKNLSAKVPVVQIVHTK